MLGSHWHILSRSSQAWTFRSLSNFVWKVFSQAVEILLRLLEVRPSLIALWSPFQEAQADLCGLSCYSIVLISFPVITKSFQRHLSNLASLCCSKAQEWLYQGMIRINYFDWMKSRADRLITFKNIFTVYSLPPSKKGFEVVSHVNIYIHVMSSWNKAKWGDTLHKP